MSLAENTAVVRRSIEQVLAGRGITDDELLADSAVNQDRLFSRQPAPEKDGIRAGLALIHEGFSTVSADIAREAPGSWPESPCRAHFRDRRCRRPDGIADSTRVAGHRIARESATPHVLFRDPREPDMTAR